MTTICLIHGKRKAREVLTRALSFKLNAEVVDFSSCERALVSSLDGHDAFVVYNNFRGRMNGVRGIEKIRSERPDVFIVGVSSTPGFGQQMLPAGANLFILRAGNEVTELIGAIRKGTKQCLPCTIRKKQCVDTHICY